MIEAFKFYEDIMPDWFMDKVSSNEVTLHNCLNHPHSPELASCDIHTLEGVMSARSGDYIIKGVQGEIYPCKPDIFEATYEVVQ